MKKIIKKILPEKLFSKYHQILAFSGHKYYKYPSEKMIIIGVTGTKGKTSTINYIWSVLETAGYKTGIISTANIRIGKKEMMNKYHMTMPGRFIIPELMSKMVKAECKFCIVETTSEGIKQFRHQGINYDILIFTNIYPEHLSSHNNSFDEYRQAKAKIFQELEDLKRKTIQNQKVPKIIISNIDDKFGKYFLSFRADEQISYGIKNQANYRAQNIREEKSGVYFSVNNKTYQTKILGKFNVYNALPAIAIADLFKINQNKIVKGLKNLEIIPGRMEPIYAGQNFNVYVDYAHEKQSITKIIETVEKIKKPEAKIVILLGAEGGGRDKTKRPIMGEIAAKEADYVVVSNVDPYEDDPKEILEDIAKSAEKNGKTRDKDLFVIEDRRAGIKKALELAEKDDYVLITGKGAEQSIIIGGKKYDWDDREVVREELDKIK